MKTPSGRSARSLWILVFLFQASLGCPPPCSCLGGLVDCSGRSLTSLPPRIPEDTTDLRLHDNLLSSLAPGPLEDLRSLQTISLHGNPWTCDCGVLDLRAWLRRSRVGVASHANCSSPPSLRGRQVALLNEDEVLQSCWFWFCDLAAVALGVLVLFVGVQAALLGALLCFLSKFQKMGEAFKSTENKK